MKKITFEFPELYILNEVCKQEREELKEKIKEIKTKKQNGKRD